MKVQIIRTAVKLFPQVLPHLKGLARWIVFTGTAEKSQEQFDARLTNLVKALYKGTIGAQSFIDSLAALISRQITLAFREAWTDEGDGGQYPDYLAVALDDFVVWQFAYVDQFARDIVDAAIDGQSIDSLLIRVPLWANRYAEAYNLAVSLIVKQRGGKLIWELGATEKHCDKCAMLDGTVAYASEWESLGVYPQSGPNENLKPSNGKTGCSGWRCDCRLSPTDKRRTRNALDKIKSIIK